MDKRFWGILGVVGLIFVGILLFNGGDSSTQGNSSGATNHVTGPNTKGVVLLEYGDYQCPFCAQYHPIIKGVTEKYGADLVFQFRNLPIPQRHKNAIAAARAAEAADMQGKFWEMYDLLYENQPDWENSNKASSIFEGYAKRLELDITKFKTDAASSAVNDRINADTAAYKETGNQISTPTFFLNGKKIEAGSVEEFSKLIDAEFEKKTGSKADL